MAGSKFDEGGGANYLCLPKDPEYLHYIPGQEIYRAALNSVEYKFLSDNASPASILSNMHNHDGPCAVCYTPNRIAKLMIPAKINCPSSWTREYYGYLMASRKGLNYRSNFICIDNNLESVPGSQPGIEPSTIYFTESTCNGLPCPPYVSGREITCAVCTK